jgi:hypothetical protein
MRRRHLHRVFNWPLRLFLEASRASVPELQRAIGGIDDGRRVPRTFFASDANRGGVNVGKPRLQRMAGCTRDRVVPGKPRMRDLKVRPVPGGIPNNPRICHSAHNSGGR